MKHSKLYIRFFTVPSKINKQGNCPLRCKISLDKKTKKFSTGIFIDPEHWDKNMQEVNPHDKLHHTHNRLIHSIKSKLLEIELELHMRGNKYDLESIYRKYNAKEDHTYGVLEYYQNYIQRLQKLVPKDLAESTWKKFYYVNNQLREFTLQKFSTDFPLGELKYQFILDFEYWLKTDKAQRQVTVNKNIQRFRKGITAAVIEEFIDRDPFMSYRAKKVKKEIVFLTHKELSKLEKTSFKQPRLERIRLMFLFCCYSGLGYSEMSSLSPKNISKGFDGNDWIQVIRQKTSGKLSIPLLPKARTFLDRLDFYENCSFPNISNQKFNSYLKEVAYLVGLEKRITHHTARKTFASTVLLYNGVPMEVVKEVLGHSSITITEESYGKILQSQISKEMSIFYSL